MTQILAWVSLIVAVTAVAIAVWQGRLSKEQLDLATETTAKTEQSLAEIRDLARDNEKSVSEIRTALDERITRILGLRLDAEKQELATKARRDDEGAEMAMSAMKRMGSMFMSAVQESQTKSRDGGDSTPPE
ncbi:hypothetical protein [Arthrobacter glacialis]|uniref:hypothetical protein n=1 Tax=Arthrobacter glacialis TaxID=1664 RepID=UPI000CD46054|nr:hypothetical protein [Arthrobacter glacialis]POH57106.1 hypothetical protein CVS28_17035 [Arthrobacter glacialis]